MITQEIRLAYTIYDLISEKSTGNPEEFSEELGMSKRHLLRNIKILRETGLDILYCRKLNSYYFSQPMTWDKFLQIIVKSEIRSSSN